MNLVVSVLPAPLSPLIIHDWFFNSSFKCVNDASAVAKTWGGISAITRPLYWSMVFCVENMTVTKFYHYSVLCTTDLFVDSQLMVWINSHKNCTSVGLEGGTPHLLNME